MGNLQEPENFNMKDLFIDVSLKTCIDNSSYDFTGKKTFNTTFYRKNIGFGITDINIEINTSLQPIIDITFKDLYGNTLLGTQRGNNDSVDTSVLFNWPPPKFIFSFKGYLGRKVTWLLNLKTTNVTFISSDASYEIKCSFVPNQWGFLSDIPVLYLLACKKLRYTAYGNKEMRIISPTLADLKGNETKGSACVFQTDSVFSYTRAGKQVETKTTEENKEFDLLTKQLASIKYGLSSAVFGTKIIKLGEPINGIINNVPIANFTNLIITNGGVSEDKLSNLSKDSRNVKQLDTFLQLNVGQGATGKPQDTSNTIINVGGIKLEEITEFGEIKGDSTNSLAEKKAKIFSIVDKNISLIEDEIKRRIYSSTKTQISKLTIGEVFRQIARDSGFILGSILQAGFDGYYANMAERDRGAKELIGNCFPLFINDKGEEIPAMTPIEGSNVKGSGPSANYGVEKYEMKFVENFIEAIGEGIAENLLSDDTANTSEDKIKNRINNLEAIQPNPYKPFYSNIVENILIRSGIIAYITRSSDPNKPGDYPTEAAKQDDSSESITTLANADMENLTKDILSQLSYEDKAGVKRFCTFFNKLISDEGDSRTVGDYAVIDAHIGEWFLDVFGQPALELKNNLNGYGEPIPDFILDYKVFMDETSELKNAIRDSLFSSNESDKIAARNKVQSFVSGASNGFLTLRDIITEVLSGKPIGSGSTIPIINTTNTVRTNIPAFYNTSAINPYTLTAINVKNNGLHWSIPKAKADQEGRYYFVLFDTPSDVSKTKEINVQDATTEDQLEGKGFFNTEENDPIGFVPIDTYANTINKDEVPNAIEIINKRIKDEECLNYSKCKTYYSDYTNYLQPKDATIQTKSQKNPNEIPAKSLSYTIYTQSIPDSMGDPSRNLVFGPLCKNKTIGDSDVRARNQRAAIKTMCKYILKKFDEIDLEKNEIIASVLGKANESRNSIYKQMHTIFHQWQVIASSIKGKEFCTKYIQTNGENLALLIEEEFGLCDNHIERGDGNQLLKDKQIEGNTLFIYDYPLAPVNGKTLNVKNSIINIEALYKPNGNTTVLNIIQQICTKNNFVFVPFPGDANSDNINEIYKPYPIYPGDEKIRNYFHVLFTPTPETRTKLSNNANEYVTDYMQTKDFNNKAISIKFGSINNQIIKGINVGTDSSKPTAESILNLQRLVDKENTNQKVGIDCSMLPIYEGRSYKVSFEMLGNSQVYPMQYFYIQTMPMFGGLHQIMKVSHSITPNNMSTKFEGIRMRFSTNGQGYGGIPPVTLDYLENLGSVSAPLEQQVYSGGTLGETVLTPTNMFLPLSPSQDMKNFTVSNIKKVLAAKKYTFFEDRLNIIGIRAKTGYTNKFDDNLVVIWKDGNGQEQSRIYSITTDPGGSLSKNIQSGHYNEAGIAIIAEGQHMNSHIMGKHKGIYPALVQASPIPYYRDKWPENGYKFNPDTLKTGDIRGFNIHRANENATSSSVNNWSEGCQVFANPNDFEEFLSICNLFIKPPIITRFTYTLIHARDFDNI
jgi:hypothetical protein